MHIKGFIRQNRAILLILAVSLVLRVVFSLDNARSLFIDIKTYENYAMSIINKGPLSISTYLPPAYPFFIAAVFKLAGTNYFYVYLAQSILGTATTLLIFLTARNMFDQRTGIIAAAVSLLYWPLTLYSGILLSETLFLFLLMAGFFFFLKALDTHKIIYFTASGALIALSTLTRSINLMLLFLLPAVYVIYNRKITALKVITINALVFMASFCIVMSPWVIRNFYLTGHFIPVDSLSGVNLYIGNNERANGFFVDITGDPVRKPGASLYEDDRILKKAAVQYIAGHPFKFAVLTAWRAFLFISFDLFQVDWVLLTYMKKNFLFAGGFWDIFSKGILFLGLLGSILSLLALKLRKSGKPAWKLLYIFLAALIVFFIQTGMLVITTRIYFNNANCGGWFDFIYNSDVLFFALAVLGYPSLIRNKKAWLAGGMIIYYFTLTSVFYIQARYRLPVMPFLAIAASSAAEKIMTFLPVVKRKLIV